MTSYPSVTNVVLYPLVTVTDRGIIGEKILGMGSEQYWITIGLEIRVWARNVKQRDEISQAIIQRLRTNQFEAAGSIGGQDLFNFRMQGTTNVSEPGDAGIRSKIINIAYDTILN